MQPRPAGPRHHLSASTRSYAVLIATTAPSPQAEVAKHIIAGSWAKRGKHLGKRFLCSLDPMKDWVFSREGGLFLDGRSGIKCVGNSSHPSV
eukprot:scaffold57111_cov31-Tisochrysis_lutea.AAC.1